MVTETELSDQVKKILRNVGKDRAFISGHPLISTVRGSVKGISFQVRLTSYRALPLSCIEDMKLSIDGAEVDMSTITFLLNNDEHKLADLPALSDKWWFILDLATIFIPMALKSGPHVVEGTLITVEPYLTAGRFSFYNSAKKTLIFEDVLAEVLS